MVVRLHEVVDREVILPVVEPRATTDDLFELDHGIDRTHQHDVADVTGARKAVGVGGDGAGCPVIVDSEPV